MRQAVGWLTPSVSAKRIEDSPLSDCRISHNALNQVLSGRPHRRSPPDGPSDAGERAQGSGPEEKCGADISYVWTRESWLYLAVVIDLFARRVVGWATGDRLHRDLALAALRKALAMRCPAAGLIHHSDRGSQYCSVDYQAELG